MIVSVFGTICIGQLQALVSKAGVIMAKVSVNAFAGQRIFSGEDRLYKEGYGGL